MVTFACVLSLASIGLFPSGAIPPPSEDFPFSIVRIDAQCCDVLRAGPHNSPHPQAGSQRGFTGAGGYVFKLVVGIRIGRPGRRLDPLFRVVGQLPGHGCFTTLVRQADLQGSGPDQYTLVLNVPASSGGQAEFFLVPVDARHELNAEDYPIRSKAYSVQLHSSGGTR